MARLGNENQKRRCAVKRIVLGITAGCRVNTGGYYFETEWKQDVRK